MQYFITQAAHPLWSSLNILHPGDAVGIIAPEQ
jgi:hypothetical protein